MRIDGRTLVVEDFEDLESVTVDPENIETFANWSPTPGPRFADLSEKQKTGYRKYSSAPEEVFESWQKETYRVTSRCINPAAAQGERLVTRQLIAGRVQSGKTTNFTGVMALLADNGYRFFIVIGGTTLPLLHQTKERLRKDLGESWFQFFSTSDDHSTWDQTASHIEQFLTDLARHEDNPNVLRPRKAICLTVLKWNEGHLNAVKELLDKVARDPMSGKLMQKLPVAIIDDECDTFTPNSNIRNPDKDATAIYRAVLGVANALPVCTYLGYTATPMANELQPLDDALKPQKVTVLEPGPDYLGPEHLFGKDSNYPTVISDWGVDAPIPESLREAVGAFLVHSILFHHEDLSVRSKFVQSPALEHSVNAATSMLVHVARETRSTDDTYNALLRLKTNWKDQLSIRPSPAGTLDSQTQALLDRYLYPAVERVGARGLIPAQTLVQLAGEALSDLGIKLIIGQGNESAVEFPPESELGRHRAWIFVGAQLLDRGQTLPNLLITYLARSSGGGAKGGEAGGNVDTLLQRGRFFGYRRQYQRLLRGFFSETSYESLKSTAQFENAMRDQLRFVDTNNLPFGLVETVYELNPATPKMRPTRTSVTPLSMKVVNSNAESWLLQWHKYGVDESTENKKLLDEVLARWFEHDYALNHEGDLTTEILPREAIEFIGRWKCHPLDNQQFEIVKRMLEHGLATQKYQNVVFSVRRTKDSNDGMWERKVPTKRDTFYPNRSSNLSPQDRKILTPSKPTIQVKVFKIVDESSGEVLLAPVPAVSFNLGFDVRYLMEMKS